MHSYSKLVIIVCRKIEGWDFMSFTHLQIKSGYSMMESTLTVDKIVSRAKELDFTSIALTDHHVLHGVIPFYKTCLKHNIKPIIGMTINVTKDYGTEQCILIAKNHVGYQNLLALSTNINIDQIQTIEKSELSKYAEGLIAILPVFNNQLQEVLLEASHEVAYEIVKNWQDLFNKGDFYLGTQDHGLAGERKLHLPLKAFHEQYSIPVVAVNDVRYLKENDSQVFDCLQAVKHDKKWSGKQQDETMLQHHLRSSIEMEQLYSSFWPSVLEESNLIAEKCDLHIDLNKRMLPSYPVPNNKSAHIYLEELCWENIYNRYYEVTPQAQERLDYELKIIRTMNFSDYFLIVWDFIEFAKSNNILVGPGRGSSASSIVAYVLGITEVDPLKYNLLFERFLNPERVSMPDIDVDFSDYRRDEVINYVRDKYGIEHVAQIITFGTFAARSVIRELIKTMEIDERDADYLLQVVPVQSGKTLVELVNDQPELKSYIQQSNQMKLLFSIAIKLEGLPRHSSTHAAGVVISEEPLIKHVPLISGASTIHLTQYPMNDLESIGLLKMDFLGLKNLTLLEKITQSIFYSEQKQIDLAHLPDNDGSTFELLQQGKTNGVFQLESPGMKRVLQRLKPNDFNDIVAVNALYRPGPMDFISTYINRKQGKEQVIYPHENLKPILKDTNGVLIYQEQIMLIAHKIAGYTLGEADLLRRAVSKKNEEMMNEQREKFINGCIKKGYDHKVSKMLFEWIVRFSNYGFPKSHAVAYSKISYQLAYLKANYPKNFFSELLSSIANQQDKTYQYINEMKKFQIALIPPSINKSYGKYSIDKNGLRMGLLSIKGIGYPVIKEIINVRKEGYFKNLFDFCLRVSLKVINRATIQQLMLAGVFDEFHSNRASLLASIDTAIEQANLFREFNDMSSLFKNTLELEVDYTDIEDFSQMQKLRDEKEAIGIYLSAHPLKEHRKTLRENSYVTLKHVQILLNKRNIKSVAIIESIKIIRTKRGEPMAFLTVSDEESEVDAVVFPDTYRKTKQFIYEDNLIFIEGKAEERNGRVQFLMNDLLPFNKNNLMKEQKKRLFINITNKQKEQALEQIKEISQEYPGAVAIIVHDKISKQTYKLSADYYVNPTQECLEKLNVIFSRDNVILKNS